MPMSPLKPSPPFRLSSCYPIIRVNLSHLNFSESTPTGVSIYMPRQRVVPRMRVWMQYLTFTLKEDDLTL